MMSGQPVQLPERGSTPVSLKLFLSRKPVALAITSPRVGRSILRWKPGPHSVAGRVAGGAAGEPERAPPGRAAGVSDGPSGRPGAQVPAAAVEQLKIVERRAVGAHPAE